MKHARPRCVGCQEPDDALIRVAGLGFVCPLCHEVLPLVWEIEIVRVREAIEAVNTFLATFQSDTDPLV